MALVARSVLSLVNLAQRWEWQRESYYVLLINGSIAN
jgi:hypothetical protein